MLRLVFQNAITFKVDEVVIPVGFMWCDIEHKNIEHCDESKAFVELRKRFQEP